MASPSHARSVVDRIAAAGLVVGEMLAYGAAITGMGLALATWTHRLSRAIAINVVLFVLIAIGWPLFIEFVVWLPLARWLTLQGVRDASWLQDGLMVISPFWAPIGTLGWLQEHRGGLAGKFWLVATAWCALAWAFAAAMFCATLRTFDRCLVRMPEASVLEDGDHAVRFDVPESGDSQLVPSSASASPRLAGGDNGCQNGDR
jgi:hypothetical protein